MVYQVKPFLFTAVRVKIRFNLTDGCHVLHFLLETKPEIELLTPKAIPVPEFGRDFYFKLDPQGIEKGKKTGLAWNHNISLNVAFLLAYVHFT